MATMESNAAGGHGKEPAEGAAAGGNKEHGKEAAAVPGKKAAAALLRPQGHNARIIIQPMELL